MSSSGALAVGQKDLAASVSWDELVTKDHLRLDGQARQAENMIFAGVYLG